MSSKKHSYSPRSKSKSLIHPKTYENYEEDTSRSCSAELFLARISKTKRSYFVLTPSSHTIHVQQYVQKPQHLLNEITLQPHASDNDTAVLLFFIHGVGGSSDMWDPQIEYFLQKGYEVVSLDLIGHGLSSKPKNYKEYEFSELAKDVLYIFDIFAKRTNVLIGHSYGSSFCTFLSKERCDQVNKLVLISGGGPTALMPDRCSAFCFPFPVFILIRPAIVKLFRRMAFHVNTSEKIRQKLTTFGISSYALKAIMQGQRWPDAGEEYHSALTVPVLLLYGRGDQFVSLDEETWMNETITGSELQVVENAGHMVMIESPAMVNHIIHKFLNRDASTRLSSLEEVDGISSANLSLPKQPGIDLELTNLERWNNETAVNIEKRETEVIDLSLVNQTREDYSTRRGSWFDVIQLEHSTENETNRAVSRVSQSSKRCSSRLKRKVMF